jgi:hypothetical protein
MFFVLIVLRERIANIHYLQNNLSSLSLICLLTVTNVLSDSKRKTVFVYNNGAELAPDSSGILCVISLRT